MPEPYRWLAEDLAAGKVIQASYRRWNYATCRGRASRHLSTGTARVAPRLFSAHLECAQYLVAARPHSPGLSPRVRARDDIDGLAVEDDDRGYGAGGSVDAGGAPERQSWHAAHGDGLRSRQQPAAPLRVAKAFHAHNQRAPGMAGGSPWTRVIPLKAWFSRTWNC